MKVAVAIARMAKPVRGAGAGRCCSAGRLAIAAAGMERVADRARRNANAQPLAVEIPPPNDWAGLRGEDYDYLPCAGERVDSISPATRRCSPRRRRARAGSRAIFVLTPFRLAGGGRRARRSRFRRAIIEPATPTPARAWAERNHGDRSGSERRSRATRSRRPIIPSKGLWFTERSRQDRRDALASSTPRLSCSAGRSAPALDDGLFGRARYAASDNPNNHLSYAVTWFGLVGRRCSLCLALYARSRVRAH